MTRPGSPTRDQFPHFRTIPTRWNDNDVYGHVNNVEYYSFFDTAINAFLIEQGEFDIHGGETVGVCAGSSCRFLAPVAFPEPVEVGLRVARTGNTSVRYEVGLFGTDGRALAEGWFVHVFVDRESRRPAAIPPGVRVAVETLTVPDS